MTHRVHRITRRQKYLVCVTALVGACFTHAQEPSIIEQSELTGSVRSRYGAIEENVSGEALSALLRATLSTPWRESWSTLLELDYVARALSDQHSDGIINNGKPLVPDAKGLDLNQVYVELDGDTIQGRLGRQRIEFDNQRFVGGNAFWQNEQTFDGLTTQLRFADSSLFQYANIYNVNRIFGDKADNQLSPADQQYGELNGTRPFARLGDHKLQSHWLRAEWNEWDYQRISSYAYFNEYPDFSEWSHRQAGIRHVFDYKFSTWRVRTQLEYAQQVRYEFDDDRSTGYGLVEAALGFRAVEFAARYEELGSNNGRTFITPLASLHDFHGIVGKFSGTPANGLVEQSVRVSWRQAPWLIELRHFQFDSAEKSVDFGRETDLSLRWRSHRAHNIMLNGGRFSDSEHTGFKDEWRTYLDYRFEF